MKKIKIMKQIWLILIEDKKGKIHEVPDIVLEEANSIDAFEIGDYYVRHHKHLGIEVKNFYLQSKSIKK